MSSRFNSCARTVNLIEYIFELFYFPSHALVLLLLLDIDAVYCETCIEMENLCTFTYTFFHAVVLDEIRQQQEKYEKFPTHTHFPFE